MTVVEIRSAAGMEALRPDWGRLLRVSPSNTIFLTWEWMRAWSAAYADPNEISILTAVDDGGMLRGIAPLRRRIARRYGQSVKTLSFLGDGSNDSEYLDFIIAPGFERQVVEAFFGYWAKELTEGTVLELKEIPERSKNLPHLRSLAEQAGIQWAEEELACGTVLLPRSWDDYLKILRPRFRTKVRSVLRNLEEHSDAKFGFCEKQGEVEEMLPALYDLHTRRWAQEGMPGVFRWRPKRVFYSSLSRQLLEQDWLRMSWLRWNGHLLACQYGFTYGDTYFHLQEGYEPASEHWGVGLGLRAWTIRQFIEQGVREYDFLGGIGRHKTDWGAAVKNSKHIVLAKATHKNIVYCRGPRWDSQVRESIRKVVPEWVLRARGARIERRQLAGVSPQEPAAAGPLKKDWLRSGLAECYFRFYIPKLTRAVRDQYSLSILPNGCLPKVSLLRRTQPCGRILYYHRVNDDGDPFFPAMPKKSFEQQIRFVARQYKIVSLSTLLRILDEDGRPENLVAVTLDDGYQDNFHNALPVLERYGVPATIFLSTESIDSREPLWFESLALAIKKTAAESVDLEIDVPRRHWLRSEGERLTANQQIFTQLRGLNDAGRRMWLGEILCRLAIEDYQDRRDKMLTWDQIRSMSARGIEFGGHTVSHPFLSKLTREQGAWEVAECKKRIETEVQSEVLHFAYPNGREEDFQDWNQDLLRDAGYRSALTTLWGMNYCSTDRMALRRGGPWEGSAALFAYKLDWYQLTNE